MALFSCLEVLQSFRVFPTKKTLKRYFWTSLERKKTPSYIPLYFKQYVTSSHISMCLSASLPNTGIVCSLKSLQRYAFTVVGAENRSFSTPRKFTSRGKSDGP